MARLCRRVPLQRHHAPGQSGAQQLRGVPAKASSQHAVVSGGRAAALHVAQPGGTHLAGGQRLQLLLQSVADAEDLLLPGQGVDEPADLIRHR